MILTVACGPKGGLRSGSCGPATPGTVLQHLGSKAHRRRLFNHESEADMARAVSDVELQGLLADTWPEPSTAILHAMARELVGSRKALEEAKAALEMGKCFCAGGFKCSRCQALGFIAQAIT